MLRKRIQTRMLVALLVVMTFVSAPLSASGTEHQSGRADEGANGSCGARSIREIQE